MKLFGFISLLVTLLFSSVATLPAQQIIADHTVVDQYINIPQQYIDIIKTWLVDIGGESHSAAYRTGMTLLAAQDSRFAATVFT